MFSIDESLKKQTNTLSDGVCAKNLPPFFDGDNTSFVIVKKHLIVKWA
jgi:hypothetical protein